MAFRKLMDRLRQKPSEEEVDEVEEALEANWELDGIDTLKKRGPRR